MLGIKDYWYGKECEGRFTDIMTFFIGNFTPETPERPDAPHIYICTPATRQLIDGTSPLDWDWLLNLMIVQEIPVTIEVQPGMLKHIPAMVRVYAHIMFMMEAEDASLLKENDSIKVLYADYSLYCTSIQNMQHVTPDDYKFDRAL